jgi:hypothetical protein
MLEIGLWILAGIAGLILLDQLFLWMERKGWVYYRKVKRQGAPPSMADVFLGANVFDQSVRHMHEAREERAGEEDEDDGDDEGKRKPEDRLS